MYIFCIFGAIFTKFWNTNPHLQVQTNCHIISTKVTQKPPLGNGLIPEVLLFLGLFNGIGHMFSLTWKFLRGSRVTSPPRPPPPTCERKFPLPLAPLREPTNRRGDHFTALPPRPSRPGPREPHTPSLHLDPPLMLDETWGTTAVLKLTWIVIYHWKLRPYFSGEPLSKTGYWLGIYHGWFHLHGLTRPVLSAKRE